MHFNCFGWFAFFHGERSKKTETAIAKGQILQEILLASVDFIIKG